MVIHSTGIQTIAIDGSYPSPKDWIAHIAKIYGPIGFNFWLIPILVTTCHEVLPIFKQTQKGALDLPDHPVILKTNGHSVSKGI